MNQSSFVPGTSLHFSLVDSNTRYGSPQALSVLAHIVVVSSLVAMLAIGPWKDGPPINIIGNNPQVPLLQYHQLDQSSANASFGRRGGSGDGEVLPPRKGFLAPGSAMPLAPPRLTHQAAILGVAPAVFDPDASPNTKVVTDLGLPWMDKDTNSAGPGKGHAIGSATGDGMGDTGGGGAGEGDDNGSYANVASSPACLYCPEPPYTDEARKAKLQGKLSVRVLVGADGHAKRMQILQGLGMGLDEQALATIRNWRFAPAQDAARHPVSTWVVIETRFQLF
jgi:periplasmic protein TonB